MVWYRDTPFIFRKKFPHGVLPSYILFGESVLPRFVLFGGTVPPSYVLFGGTVLPNSFTPFKKKVCVRI